jgi:hypothetical protein
MENSVFTPKMICKATRFGRPAMLRNYCNESGLETEGPATGKCKTKGLTYTLESIQNRIRAYHLLPPATVWGAQGIPHGGRTVLETRAETLFETRVPDEPGIQVSAAWHAHRDCPPVVQPLQPGSHTQIHSDPLLVVSIHLWRA